MTIHRGESLAVAPVVGPAYETPIGEEEDSPLGDFIEDLADLSDRHVHTLGDLLGFRLAMMQACRVEAESRSTRRPQFHP